MTAVTDAQAVVADVQAYVEILRDEDQELVFNEVEREVATLRAELHTAIEDLRFEQGVDAAIAVTALGELADDLQTLAEKRAESLRRLVPYTPDADTNHTLVAFELYQDPTRGIEIVDLNPGVVFNPNKILSGTELQVYDR